MVSNININPTQEGVVWKSSRGGNQIELVYSNEDKEPYINGDALIMNIGRQLRLPGGLLVVDGAYSIKLIEGKAVASLNIQGGYANANSHVGFYEEGSIIEVKATWKSSAVFYQMGEYHCKCSDYRPAPLSIESEFLHTYNKHVWRNTVEKPCDLYTDMARVVQKHLTYFLDYFKQENKAVFLEEINLVLKRIGNSVIVMTGYIGMGFLEVSEGEIRELDEKWSVDVHY